MSAPEIPEDADRDEASGILIQLNNEPTAWKVNYLVALLAAVRLAAEQRGASLQKEKDAKPGWVLVPAEPTKAMHEAGELVECGIGGSPPAVGNIYRAMLAAIRGEG